MTLEALAQFNGWFDRRSRRERALLQGVVWFLAVATTQFLILQSSIVNAALAGGFGGVFYAALVYTWDPY